MVGAGPSEQQRYARQLGLAGFGPDGQRALGAARVAVVGGGGLGVPVGQYLVAAGVGFLRVIDDDVIELSNLHRQVVHRQSDLGEPKVSSFVRLARELNDDVEVEALQERVHSGNVLDLLNDVDVVVDATDNFAARFLLNDACVLLGLPLVWAAVQRFDGQLTVWSSGQGPCLRCVFPEPPDPSAVPSCAEAGVLGVLPGILGVAQANEVIKLVTGIGRPLVGRLAVHDALEFRWQELPLARNPLCPSCAPEAIPSLGEVEQLCAGPVVPEVSVDEVAAGLADGTVRLVDVRTTAEWDVASVQGAVLLPLDDLRAGRNPAEGPGDLVLMCASGARSKIAVALLADRGVRAHSMVGGMDAWTERFGVD